MISLVVKICDILVGKVCAILGWDDTGLAPELSTVANCKHTSFCRVFAILF